MDITFFLTALLFVSATIALTVEAIKKVSDSIGKKPNATILAVIVSFIESVACSVAYIIYNAVQVNAQVIVVVIAFVFFSFLCATVGYDKVVKEIFEKVFKKDNK